MQIVVSNSWRVAAVATLAPTFIANVSDFGVQTIAGGSAGTQDLTPTLFANSSAFGSPAIANWLQFLEPISLASETIFGGPTIANAASPMEVHDIGTAANWGYLTATITVPGGGVPAGSLIVVAASTYTASSFASVTDTAGNTYSQAIGGGDPRADIWYCKNCMALSPGDTIVSHLASADYSHLSALYALNADTSAPLDQTAHASGSGTTPSVSTGALSVAGELVVGAVGTSFLRTVTQAAGYAAPPDEEYSFYLYALYGGSLIASGTGAQTYNPTKDDSGAWSAAIATFKPA